MLFKGLSLVASVLQTKLGAKATVGKPTKSKLIPPAKFPCGIRATVFHLRYRPMVQSLEIECLGPWICFPTQASKQVLLSYLGIRWGHLLWGEVFRLRHSRYTEDQEWGRITLKIGNIKSPRLMVKF